MSQQDNPRPLRSYLPVGYMRGDGPAILYAHQDGKAVLSDEGKDLGPVFFSYRLGIYICLFFCREGFLFQERWANFTESSTKSLSMSRSVFIRRSATIILPPAAGHAISSFRSDYTGASGS